MKRLGMVAAGCGTIAATAALNTPAAVSQTSFTTNIVYTSHDTPDAAQGKLACDADTNTTSCHIYVMNTSGSGRAITSGPGNDVDPAFSPDGTRIAFARATSGPQGQYDIYVMNADGTNLKQLTDEPKDDRYPAWSPNGQTIAFRGYPAVGGAAIFKMSPDGSGKTAIQNTGGGDQPTWSPDGSRVAYAGAYPDPAGTIDPNTGKTVIFSDIFVQPVNAGNADLPKNVTNNPQTNNRYPSWQPTAGSSQILYRRASLTLQGRELWRVDESTGNQTNLTVAQTNSRGRAASWAPDGTSVAFVSFVDGEGDQEIWLGGVAGNAITGARQLTNNAITDDEPKLANVPVPASAVPPPAAPAAPGGATGGGPASVGTVSDGGQTITVGGGKLPDGRDALSLALTVPKQSLGRRKTLRAFVRCNAKCSVDVTGSTKMKVGGKSRTLRLYRVKKTIKGKSRAALSLRIPTKTLRSVRSALRRHRTVKFTISAVARTSAGEFTPAAIRPLTLRR